MIGVLLTIVHVIVCLFLIVVILLQSGKAADLAGAFGGMGSQTAFGPAGLGDTAFKGDDDLDDRIHADVHLAVDYRDERIWFG